METFQEILKDVLYIIVTGCAGALVAYFGTLIKQKVAENTQSKALNLAVGSVVDAVETVAMTYVDDLKKAGEFTDEAKQNAKETAISIAKTLITEDTQKVIEAAYGDYETWLSAKIESVLKEEK